MPAQQQHNHFGSYANAAALPNDTAEPNLKDGDLAYAIAEANTYTCTDATAGTWASGGGGGAGSYIEIGGDYSYTEAATPIEETIGETQFDGSLASTTMDFIVVLNTSLTTGNASVKLYDLGPIGAPTAPRLVTTLTTSTSGGPQSLSQTLTPNSPAGANEYEPANHFFRVIVTSAAQVGDTVYIGNARLEVQ